jgi:hypothetical protein
MDPGIVLFLAECCNFPRITQPQIHTQEGGKGEPAPSRLLEFIRRFQPLIAGVVARTATLWTTVTAELVDELVQKTCLTLCTRRLREFQSYCHSAIHGFLKSVAYDVTMDYFKEQCTFKRSIKTLRASDLDVALQTEATKGLPADDTLVHEMEEFIKSTESPTEKGTSWFFYSTTGRGSAPDLSPKFQGSDCR